MTLLGLTSASVAYLMTGSWGWAVVGLLGAGVVANAIANARAPARSVAQRGQRRRRG